jgi:ELWxxDGT repeat protein
MPPSPRPSRPCFLSVLPALILLVSLSSAHQALDSAEPILVKDVNTVLPGSQFLPAGQSIEPPVEMGGFLYFPANDGYHGRELWRTDGTAEGTTLVRDINPGRADATRILSPFMLSRAGETLFFRAYDGVSDAELWKSDGTAEGTQPVREMGSGRLWPYDLFSAHGLLYFYGSGDSGNSGLWRSDGTHEGTFRLVNARASQILAMHDRVFFSSSDRLWVTDGTPEGTHLLRNQTGTLIRRLAAAGEWVFFTAENPAAVELWKSNGTQEGTILVKTMSPAPGEQVPLFFTGVHDVLFFRGWGADWGALWKCDGTAEGTVKIKEIPGYPSGPIVAMGEHLYFAGAEGLWQSDGTPEGTIVFHSRIPQILIEHDDALYFTAANESNRELWKTDGSPEGTLLLREFPAGKAAPNPAGFTSVWGKLFFSADDGENGRELWMTDGTEEGTVQVTRISRFTEGSSPAGFFEFGAFVYFRANDGRSPWPNLPQLWRSDGTAEGTEKISPDWHAVQSHAVVGDTIFFAPRYTLWKSDGTREGTEMVMEISPKSSGQIGILTPVGDLLYFSGNDSVHGAELWRSDGTDAGTFMVKDIRPGGFSSSPGFLTDIGGQLFFRADDGILGFRLWKSDGTPGGTVMVSDVPTYPHEITEFEGVAYFAGGVIGSGRELWKSDGTAEGTVMVIDLEPGPGSSTPAQLTVAGNFLYFTALGGLWRTDGTADGTRRLKTIDARNLTAAAGRLIFTVSPADDGFEIWTSDGTAEGTLLARTVDDLFDLKSVRGVGRDLWISASRIDVGSEVFKISLDDRLPPTIVARPLSHFAQSGSSLTLSLAALGGDLDYQWYHDGFPIPGAVSSILVLQDLDPSFGGIYSVTVRNAAGETATSLRVTIDPQAPTMTLGPSDSGKLRLRFETTAAGRYQVQFSDDLANWTTAAESLFDQSGTEVDFVDEPPGDVVSRFYRLVVLP